MNKSKKRSSQKQFLQTMIITGVLGISIMMVVTLYMIKLFAPQKVEMVPDQLTPTIQKEGDIESRRVRGVIHQIGSNNKNIKLWDIEESVNIKIQIKDKTQIQDSYGKPMSRQEVNMGDIVELTYESKSKDILTLQKSPRAWEKHEIINPEIREQNKTLKIGNKTYDYTDHILITNEQLERIDISEIDDFDTLQIKGLNNTIWSIQVLQSAGYIQLSNIPTKEGTIEIGNKQIYQLADIQDNISLPAGAHKIVIRMEGYQPFAETINISTGQVYEIDLKDVEEAIATLDIKVINVETDYKVEIDNKTYKKDETIQLRPEEYKLKLTADGYELLEMTVVLKEGENKLNLKLEAKPQGAEETQSKPETEAPDKTEPVEERKTVQIIIETDPKDAQVFVGGVYKGTTPALTGLRAGEYSITIEKEGYSTLYSTIVIDESNAQKGFLYTLQKEE